MHADFMEVLGEYIRVVDDDIPRSTEDTPQNGG